MTTAAMKEVVILREIALNCETEKITMHIYQVLNIIHVGAPQTIRS